MITIKHSERVTFRKVTCDCVEPGDCDSDICNTHSIAYLLGKQPPNYPVPATLDVPQSLIAWLWVKMPRTKHNNKKLTQWFVTLCFDRNNRYIG